MPPRQATYGKAKNFKKTFPRMVKDLKPEALLLVAVMIFSIFSSVLAIISPVILREFLNLFSPQFNGQTPINNSLLHFTPSMTAEGIPTYLISIQWTTVAFYVSIIISIYVLSAILSWLGEWISVSVSSRYAYQMRDRIQQKLNKLPLSYFDRVPYGDTLSVGTNDVDNISRNLQSIISQTCSSITLFVGTFIAMFVIEYRLAFVALVSLPFTILIVIFVAKFSQKQFSSYRNELGILNGKVEENYAGYKIIKLFNKEQDVIEDFNKTNKKMARSDGLSQFFSGFIFPSTNFIHNLAFVGIAVVGGIINDPSTMIVFFLFLNLFSRPFQQIGQIFNIIQSVVASGERIYEILDEPEESSEENAKVVPENSITGKYQFDNVSFSYSPDKPLIENLNLNVYPGETVAIVGPTGAGKTTLVNLIMRFYDVTDGSLKLDGVDVRDYKRSLVRGVVGMVLQDTWLFKGTIRENITYGQPDASEEELISACKQAHIYHFIQTLPNGFDYMLNEDGNNISQGQRQLITIARAILSKPKVMILDEATSSVDTRTEQQIQDAMNKIMEGRTSFIIAHRLSTIKNAKLILVMKKGHIIEKGDHQSLLKANGFYAELYNSQFLGTLNNENEEKEES